MNSVYKKEYYYGIEILRIVSMFFVVILHILGRGGVLEHTSSNSIAFAVVWFLEICCYCAVNCYALISGFVGFSEEWKSHKISRFIELWMQVVFYCVVATIGCYIWNPELVGIKALIQMFLPITFDQYWYFTAYTIVFLMMPWLNQLVQHTTKRNMFSLLCIFIVIFSIYTTATQRWVDPFNIKGGYGIIWLIVLYIMGAVIKKYQLFALKGKKWLIIMGCCFIAFTYAWKIGIGLITKQIFGSEKGTGIFITYVSPTILGIALVLLVCIANIKISERVIKIIKIISPASFGVYLLHTHPLVFENIIAERYSYIGDLSLWRIPIEIFFQACIIFVLGICVDKIRKKLFGIIRINSLIHMIEHIILRVASYTESMAKKILKVLQ